MITTTRSIHAAVFYCFVSIAQADSLCKYDEVSYFSCKVDGSGKMVSLCGQYPDVFRPGAEDADTLMREKAFLSYRFGTREKPELEYPRKRKKSLELFEGVFLKDYYEIYFRNGSYVYDVYRYNIGDGGPLRGVKIYREDRKGRKLLKDLPCQKETADDSLYELVNIVDQFGGLVVRHPSNVPPQ